MILVICMAAQARTHGQQASTTYTSLAFRPLLGSKATLSTGWAPATTHTTVSHAMWYIATLYCFFILLYGILLYCQSLSIVTVHVMQVHQSPLKVLGCTQHGLRSAITKNEQVYEVHSSIEHMLRTSTDQLDTAVYGNVLINEHDGMNSLSPSRRPNRRDPPGLSPQQTV